MRTIQNVNTVEIKIVPSELMEGKWLNLQLLSKKISDIEKEQNLGYKSLRTKLYNGWTCNKYNTQILAGLKCIDVDNPMKANASLVIKFIRG